MTDLIEWCARTYGWRLSEILHEVSAVQVALLFRQWSTAIAGSKAITLQEIEVMERMLSGG